MSQRNEEIHEMPLPSDEMSLPSEVPTADGPPQPCRSKLRKRVVAFYFTNEFIILAIVAILLAKAYPPLGAEYLQPQITASWIAVIFLFCKFWLRRMHTSLHDLLPFWENATIGIFSRDLLHRQLT